MAKFGIKQSDFSKGLTITGSLVTSGSSLFLGSQVVTGSIVATDGVTGSLKGTSSYAVTASYAEVGASSSFALSSSYAATASFAPNYTLTSTFVSASASFDNRITSTSGSLSILSGSYEQSSASFDDRITDNSASIADLSSSFEQLSSSFIDLNLTQIASGSYTASIGANGFQVNTSASISGSLTVQGTITAQTLVVQTITSSQELITGSLIVSGSLNAYGGVTGSLQGTSSWAVSSSYALAATSASYTATASYVNPLTQDVLITGSLEISSSTGEGININADTLLFVGSASFTGFTAMTGSLVVTDGITGSLFGTASYALNYPLPFQIVSGSVTASVSEDPSNLFLIKSGSFSYINIASNSNTTINSNLFIIKNFTTQQPVLTVSQSIISFATQSSDPSGTANNGAFWFTSTNLYVGLD